MLRISVSLHEKTTKSFHFHDVYKMGALKSEGHQTLPLQTDERLRGASALHRVPLPHCYLHIINLCCAKSQQIQDGVFVVRQNDVSLVTVTDDT